jgi:hypothetical protein
MKNQLAIAVLVIIVSVFIIQAFFTSFLIPATYEIRPRESICASYLWRGRSLSRPCMPDELVPIQ